MPVEQVPEPKKRLWCAFCGKNDDECDDLVAGPTVLICGDCIDLARDIVVRARARRAKQAKAIQDTTDD